MITADPILVDAGKKLLSDLCTSEVINNSENGTFASELWQTLEEMGMTLVSLPEAAGGSGATLTDAFSLLHQAGYYAAPVPLAETFLASLVLHGAGIVIPAGPLTLIPVDNNNQLDLSTASGKQTLTGKAVAVPWARHAKHLVVCLASSDGMSVTLIPQQAVSINEGVNMAGEPCDDIVITDYPVASDYTQTASLSADTLYAIGALTRAAMMAGATEKVLDQTVQYAGERVQFGRPIGKFQAIQQELALLAGERAAAEVIVDRAVAELENGLSSTTAQSKIAAAKTRVGEAADLATRVGHQVHGAMGFTYEHSLHHCTRRLWSWREEYGIETEWSVLLGKQIIEQGRDQLWPWVCE